MSHCNQSDISDYTLEKLFQKPDSVEKSDRVYTFNFEQRRRPKLICFRPRDQCFATTALPSEPLFLEGIHYTSVDHYVWTKKFTELVGRDLPDDLERIGYARLFNQEFLNRKKVEKWILGRGLLHLQKAILRRVQTDNLFYQQLLETGHSFLVCTNSVDRFFATDLSPRKVFNWLKERVRDGKSIKIPRFPLIVADLHYLPDICESRNVLGSIYMALRERLRKQGDNGLRIYIPDQFIVPGPVHHCQLLAQRKRANQEQGGAQDPKRPRHDTLFVDFPIGIDRQRQREPSQEPGRLITPEQSTSTITTSERFRAIENAGVSNTIKLSDRFKKIEKNKQRGRAFELESGELAEQAEEEQIGAPRYESDDHLDEEEIQFIACFQKGIKLEPADEGIGRASSSLSISTISLSDDSDISDLSESDDDGEIIWDGPVPAPRSNIRNVKILNVKQEVKTEPGDIVKSEPQENSEQPKVVRPITEPELITIDDEDEELLALANAQMAEFSEKATTSNNNVLTNEEEERLLQGEDTNVEKSSEEVDDLQAYDDFLLGKH